MPWGVPPDANTPARRTTVAAMRPPGTPDGRTPVLGEVASRQEAAAAPETLLFEAEYHRLGRLKSIRDHH
jgi:hypothetical protein